MRVNLEKDSRTKTERGWSEKEERGRKEETRVGWNWWKKQKESFRNLWKGDRIGDKTKKYGQTMMKATRAKRTWESDEIETVLRINWTDS